jgi:hypothetical protein
MTSTKKINKYKTLNGLVTRFRNDFNNDLDFILLYAHNGAGKTRTSMEFKDKGKRFKKKLNNSGRDTLYFNAYTEDLFVWDNDLENDSERCLSLNSTSNFFDGFEDLALEQRILKYLERYGTFEFKIDYKSWKVHFEQRVKNPKYHPNNQEPEFITESSIKISRGEENLFKWCFFLAICEITIDDVEREGKYKWVDFIYIDDPISSLDDNNAIAVATDLVSLIKKANGRIKALVSTHHSLFYNVLWNELRSEKVKRYFLYKDGKEGYTLQKTDDTPYFHHVALLSELQKAAERNKIYSYHFNALRSILEKTASFFGQKDIKFCLEGINDETLYNRALNLLSHGRYSIYQPVELTDDNKALFKRILKDFTDKYEFDIPQLTS